MINAGDVQTHANLIFNGNREFYLRTRFAFRVLRTIKPSPSSVKFATWTIPSLSWACSERVFSNPDIMVMKSAKDGMRFDASGLLNWTRDRRIFVQ